MLSDMLQGSLQRTEWAFPQVIVQLGFIRFSVFEFSEAFHIH